MKLLILILILILIINSCSNNNNNIFVNSEANNNNNIAEAMTGINDIINKHYKEYIDRNPNIQQSNVPYQQENDPIRGHACDHDKIMQKRLEQIQESNRVKRELEQQQQQTQQDHHDN